MLPALGALILAGALVLLGGPVRAQEARLAESWVPMIEGCLGYAETGLRSVFGGWDIASDGGGACNGDPACEDDDMTFIAPVPDGTAAVTVRVGAADWVGQQYFASGRVTSMVGNYPDHVFCRSAESVRHSTADLGDTHEAWVQRQRVDGRLAPAEGYVSPAAGPYVGCGYDGRPFLIEFSLARPGAAILRMNYPTRARAADGAGCTGVTS